MKKYKVLIYLSICVLCLSCSKEETKQQHTDYYANCSYDEFGDLLADTIKSHIQSITEETIDSRTFFLYQPARMTYQSFFSSDSIRIEGWYESLCSHGLSRDSLNTFINQQIADYNSIHKEDPVQSISLQEIRSDDIINTEALGSIKFMEWLATADVIHFLLCTIPGINICWAYLIMICLFPIILILWILISITGASEKTTNSCVRGFGIFLLTIIVITVFLVTTFLCINESNTLIDIITNNYFDVIIKSLN